MYFNTGNVGIGTTASSVYLLDVAGTAYINTVNTNTLNVMNGGNFQVSGTCYMNAAAQVQGNMSCLSFVGIGTNSPSYPLHITSQTSGAYSAWYYGYNTSQASSGTDSTISIWAQGTVHCAGLYVTSDKRLKKNIKPISERVALSKIRQLEPVSYQYVDREMGDDVSFGLIAQDVLRVMPAAVSETNGYVPNIYKLCNVEKFKGSYKVLYDKCDLFVGDVVRMILENGSDASVKVASMDRNGFVVQSDDLNEDVCKQLDSGKVFVYGINDKVKHVDYRSLFIIGLSAIKELDKKVQELETKISVIEKFICCI